VRKSACLVEQVAQKSLRLLPIPSCERGRSEGRGGRENRRTHQPRSCPGNSCTLCPARPPPRSGKVPIRALHCRCRHSPRSGISGAAVTVSKHEFGMRRCEHKHISMPAQHSSMQQQVAVAGIVAAFAFCAPSVAGLCSVLSGGREGPWARPWALTS